MMDDQSTLEADAVFSYLWSEDNRLEFRALALVRSMAAVKCRNKYPVGVIGREARNHYNEARQIVLEWTKLQSVNDDPH